MGITPAVAALFVVAAVALGLRVFFALLALERRRVEEKLKRIDEDLKRLEEPARREVSGTSR